MTRARDPLRARHGVPRPRRGIRRDAGTVHIYADMNNETGEYAILVRSDLKGGGLGWLLMKTMIDYAQAEGLRVIEGEVLRENTMMLRMCTALGFKIDPDPEDPAVCHVVLVPHPVLWTRV